jgi:DNA polymerase-1
MKLLVDADFIVYKACAGAEDEINWGDDVITVISKFSEAYRNVDRDLTKIKAEFMWDVPEMILFFSDSKNFRKKIYPDYKGHRNRKKPCGYRRVITELGKHYEVIRLPELEADDAMGIYATAHEGNVICSPDKDMRQIPGRLFDMKELTMIDPVEGAKWHLIQSLAGDQTDGYSGVPGIGIKRAVALFEEDGYTWQTVVKAFEAKELTEDDALMNARLARILTCNDYDPIEHTVIPWTPTADYRADS